MGVQGQREAALQLAALRLQQRALTASSRIDMKLLSGLGGAAGKSGLAGLPVIGPVMGAPVAAGITAIAAAFAGLIPATVAATSALAAFGALAVPTIAAVISGTGNLTASQEKLHGQLLGLKDAWSNMATAFAPQVTGIMTTAIGLLGRGLAEVGKLAGIVAPILTRAFAGFAASPLIGRFFAMINQVAPVALKSLLQVAGTLGGGLVRAFLALKPAVVPALTALQLLAQSAAALLPPLAQLTAALAPVAVALAAVIRAASALVAPVLTGLARIITVTGQAVYAAGVKVGDFAARLFHVTSTSAQFSQVMARVAAAHRAAGAAAAEQARDLSAATRWAGTFAAVISRVANILTSSLTPALAMADATIGIRNAEASLSAALKVSHGRIALNTQAARDSYSALNSLMALTQADIGVLAKYGGANSQAAGSLRGVLGYLLSLESQSPIVRSMIDAIRQALLAIPANIYTTLHIQTVGNQIVAGTPAPPAARRPPGARPPGARPAGARPAGMRAAPIAGGLTARMAGALSGFTGITSAAWAYSGMPAVPAASYAGTGGTGGTTTIVNYNIDVKADASTHPADVGRAIVEKIKAHEQRSGKSWRS